MFKKLLLYKKILVFICVVVVVIITPIILQKTFIRKWVSYYPKQSDAAAITTINVNPDSVVGNINPLIFGNSMLNFAVSYVTQYNSLYNDRTETGHGVWDPVNKQPVPEMVSLAKNTGMSVTRLGNGSDIHYYDWKKTIGPIHDSSGKQIRQKFGLPEMLKLSEHIGATPIIEVSEYIGTKTDAANLVEYLNAPNDGKHPWAAKRAADGRSAPWNVIYFEFGNESYDPRQAPQAVPLLGINTAIPAITFEQYSKNYFEYQTIMKSIDSKVKLGAVFNGNHWQSNWDEDLLGSEKTYNKKIDFLIQHTYTPWYAPTSLEQVIPARDLFAASLTSGVQSQSVYDTINSKAKKITGLYIPIAVTEYNGAFVHHSSEPPYQYSLGEALLNAELVATHMQPRNNIMLATFWQYANSYFGQVKGSGAGPFTKRPHYYTLELYNNHFGKVLINSSVSSPTYEATYLKRISLINTGTTVSYVTAIASKSADSNKLYIMVVNKNLDNKMPTNVNLGNFKAGKAKIYTLTGPSIEATNETNPNNVTVKESSKVINGSLFSYDLEPRSITAIEISKTVDAPIATPITPNNPSSPTISSSAIVKPGIASVNDGVSIKFNDSLPKGVTGVKFNISEVVPKYKRPKNAKLVKVYDITATDQNGQPLTPGFSATCTINYIAAKDSEEKAYGIVYWDGTKWSKNGISNVKKDLSGNSISFDTNHFTVFAIVLENRGLLPYYLSALVVLAAVAVCVSLAISRKHKKTQDMLNPPSAASSNVTAIHPANNFESIVFKPVTNVAKKPDD